MLAPDAIRVVLEFCSGPRPWKLPPISTLPPPAWPDASMLAVPLSSSLSPSTLTVPPLRPAALPVALREPLSVTWPLLPPLSTIMQFCSTAESARMTPDWLITVASASPAALASKATWPPLAVMLPLFTTAALATAASTDSLTRPAPEVSMVAREPAPSPTEPASALMLPLLVTPGASRNT